MPPSNHWRVPAHSKLTWRRWPDENEYVFYHDATGDTHRLSELAGLIMEQALSGPVAVVNLKAWLREQGDESPDASLDHVFASLTQLELIEAVNIEPGDAAS